MEDFDKARLVIQLLAMAAGGLGALLGYFFLARVLEPVVWEGWAKVLGTMAGAASGGLIVTLIVRVFLKE